GEFAKRHTRVVAVSVDDLEDSKKTKENVPHLVVVADTDHKLVNAGQGQYGSGNGKEVAAAPTTLVDKQCVGRPLHPPTNVASRLSPSEVLAMVDKDLAVP